MQAFGFISFSNLSKLHVAVVKNEKKMKMKEKKRKQYIPTLHVRLLKPHSVSSDYHVKIV